MQIRLECLPGDSARCLAAIQGAFQVESVSKPHMNVRQTGIEGTPCEARYYIRITGVRPGGTPQDLLTMDMLRFLDTLSKTYGMDTAKEIEKLRAFHDAAPDMTDVQRFELMAEWRASLLSRAIGKEGGGAGCRKG